MAHTHYLSIYIADELTVVVTTILYVLLRGSGFLLDFRQLEAIKLHRVCHIFGSE